MVSAALYGCRIHSAHSIRTVMCGVLALVSTFKSKIIQKSTLRQSSSCHKTNLGFLILNLARGSRKMCTIYNFRKIRCDGTRERAGANETILSCMFVILSSRLETWAVRGFNGDGGGDFCARHRTIWAPCISLSCCRSQNLVVTYVYEMDSHLQRITWATPRFLLLLLVGVRTETPKPSCKWWREEKEVGNTHKHTHNPHMWMQPLRFVNVFDLSDF